MNLEEQKDILEDKRDILFQKIDNTAEDTPEWSRLHAEAEMLTDEIHALEKLIENPQYEESDFSGATKGDR
jgi:hypothetical protein